MPVVCGSMLHRAGRETVLARGARVIRGAWVGRCGRGLTTRRPPVSGGSRTGNSRYIRKSTGTRCQWCCVATEVCGRARRGHGKRDWPDGKRADAGPGPTGGRDAGAGTGRAGRGGRGGGGGAGGAGRGGGRGGGGRGGGGAGARARAGGGAGAGGGGGGGGGRGGRGRSG